MKYTWTGVIDITNLSYWIAEDRLQRTEYYKDGSNTWGDDFYDIVHDAIVDYLEEHHPTHEFLNAVGADFDSEWEVKEHEYPMGSLAKCKLLEDYDEWANKYNGLKVLQHKLDGISIALTYDNGKLTKSATRSTGTKGEDITRNVLKMKGIPNVIDFKGHVVFRGEILLYHTDFAKVNKVRASNDDAIYKNPRNAAAGMAKDQKGTYAAYLTVQIYDIMNMKDMKISDEVDAIDFIKSQNFIPVHYYHCTTTDDAHAIYEDYVANKRLKLNWDIDGLVIKTAAWTPCQGKAWKKPKNKIAWKFPPQRARTVIIRIEASSATRITPVAVFEPVECGGVTIQRASLANWKLCLDKNVGPGAKVEISRRNDVIPYVESVLEAGETPEIPKLCPTCGSPTEWELNTSGEETAYLICSNLSCPNKLVKLIHKWLNIHEAKGVGVSFVDKVVTDKMVTNLMDFLNFPFMLNHQTTLMNTDGFGKRKMKKINTEIEKTCKTTVWKFFSGLNFKGIGSTRIQAVIDAITEEVTVKSFINFVLSTEDITGDGAPNGLHSIESFGDGLAPLLVSQLKKNLDLIDTLQGIVLIEDVTQPTKDSSIFEGMSFCFTGIKGADEPSILKRKVAEAQVIANGGICSGVSKTLSYLVTNDPNGSTNKIKKAKSLGVKIILETEYLNMLGIEKEKEEQILFGLDSVRDEPSKNEPKKDDQVLFGLNDI